MGNIEISQIQYIHLKSAVLNYKNKLLKNKNFVKVFFFKKKQENKEVFGKYFNINKIAYSVLIDTETAINYIKKTEKLNSKLPKILDSKPLQQTVKRFTEMKE